jgi:hypothetical protein
MSLTSKNSVQKARFNMAIKCDKSSVSKLLNPSKNKYKSIPNEYNGVTYHSTKEADYAMRLDYLIKSKVVERWERQITFALGINGVLITKYRLDFKVWYSDGSIKFIDVKGYKKGQAFTMFQMKQRLMKAILDIDVEIV